VIFQPCFLEYRWDFLWCCWAIVWGIGQYRAASKSAATEPAAADPQQPN
jgi:hypothetical protein